jgi:hypothetical protein
MKGIVEEQCAGDRRKIEEMAPILPPDHKPIPTGIERVKEAAPAAVRSGVIALSVYQPVGEMIYPDPVVQAIKQPDDPDDPERADYSVPLSYMKERGVQSTSDAMPFNNFDWPVPQRRVGLHPSQMMFSTNAALLFGSSSTGG